MQRTPFLAALLALGLAAGTAAAQEIDTLALRAHTRFLADDLLEGRGTGTSGELVARLYLASQLQRIGARGAAPDGEYLQPVPLRRATPVAAETRLILGPDPGTTFEMGSDFVWGRGGNGAFRSFRGTGLFAGNATVAARATAGLTSLDGQVIVLLGTLPADARPLLDEWRRKGAAGAVMLATDETAFRNYAAAAGGPFTFVAQSVDEPVWQPELPTIVAGPAVARALLANVTVTDQALSGEQPFDAIPLGQSIDVQAAFRMEDLDASNVAAIVPGSDPARANEYVVYTAHYDHLGIGTPDANGDAIYNGFSDNAAGTAMLLAIADALARNPTARPALFLFFTGEELGLLGSSYYVANPLVPLNQVVAVINLDGGAPPAPPLQWRIAGGNTSTLGELASEVASRRGWEANSSTTSPNSDHWPFLARQIPAVFIIPGLEWEGLNSVERETLASRWSFYHQPGDHWHPEFPFAGLQRYAEIALALGRRVGDATDRPRWIGF